MSNFQAHIALYLPNKHLFIILLLIGHKNKKTHLYRENCGDGLVNYII
jgi:hypothetical protein